MHGDRLMSGKGAKDFLGKIRDNVKNHGRRYTQLVAAVLYNCNLKGFFTGRIYTGASKGLCVPGLNCYSCPGAVAACPLGSLQSGLAGVRYKFPFYVLGTLLLFGLLFGRFICGFLCPVGLVQELLFKIPSPKIKKSRVTRALSYVKYAVLAVFVVLIPLILSEPGFCKYVCPAGTAEAGVPLTIGDETLRGLIGSLFSWKVAVLIVAVVVCVFCFRAFCRFICPHGALYSFFNRVALFGVKVDEKKCTGCGACARECRLDVKKVCDRECVHCGDCIDKCPEHALRYGGPLTERKRKNDDLT